MNTFAKVADALANNKSFAEIAIAYGISERKVVEIYNSLQNPAEAYQMQIEQNFFDKYGI